MYYIFIEMPMIIGDITITEDMVIGAFKMKH